MPFYLPTAIRITAPNELFKKAFLFLLFLYFLTLSADLLSVYLLFFTVKLTNFIGLLTFISYLTFYGGKLAISRNFFLVTISCLASLSLSALLGYNLIACLGFILFFIFNYWIYFVLPSELFSVFNEKLILRIYFFSFLCIGAYATIQVFLSCCGVILPHVSQVIAGRIARAQGLSYETSYYALYMTPFTIFQTTQYLLQDPRERSLKDLVVANFLLLISTSSGCIFTYLAFLACLGLFKFINILKKVSVLKVLYKFALYAACASLFMSLINPELVSGMFLKFFFTKFTHNSFLERWNGLVMYWFVFLENFWTGTGLGGATTFLLLKLGATQINLLDPNTLRAADIVATNVTTELLASLGIIGGICFGFLFWVVYKKFRNAYRIPHMDKEDHIKLTAFALSLCVTFFTLQFNQSIMRCYIWAHLGICIGYIKYLHLKYQKMRQHESSIKKERGHTASG